MKIAPEQMLFSPAYFSSSRWSFFGSKVAREKAGGPGESSPGIKRLLQDPFQKQTGYLRICPCRISFVLASRSCGYSALRRSSSCIMS